MTTHESETDIPINDSGPFKEPLTRETSSDDMNTDTTDIESLQRELAEWKDLAQRRSADVENIRRRARQREDELVAYSSEHVITKMLPVLDDLHAAVQSSASATDVNAVRTGIEMIYNKALKIFTDAGVAPIETDAGEPFDVDKHEALMHTTSEHPEGAVVQTVQRGYQLHDKVIRHAKVITSAGAKDDNA